MARHGMSNQRTRRELRRARCSARGTPGSGGGSEKPTSGNAGRALRADLTVTPGSAGTPPASVHHGTAEQIRADRQRTLDAAWATHPHRFGRRRPQPPRIPNRAWINKPDNHAPEQVTASTATTPPAAES